MMHSVFFILSRGELLYSLRHTPKFDVLVIGGGATGCGVALDAATRGLKTALVEKYDYSSGTSSRSTKLIHGGVRYLQKAVFNLDYGQYKLVREALHERANLLEIAPHLSNPLPIMLPVYKWWQVPYFWAGIKLYDLVAGKQLVKSSYFLSKEKALETFPMLQSDKLCGAIVYYDGQHNDSRMNLCIALTAIRKGATCVNHVEVVRLLKKKEKKEGEEEKEVVCGARLRERFSGEEWDVYAKSVVNATGPFTDDLRKMDNNQRKKICQPSSGIHIVLPDYYSPSHMGLLDPATSDGRVIFFLPWESKTIAGTTDSPCNVTFHPHPKEAEIQFILQEIKDYLNPDVHVRRGDVLAAWSGIRPLVTDPSSKDTESISRNHVIEVSDGNMITIAGGKWTTYRAMAKDAVDTAVKVCGLTTSNECKTKKLFLEGGEGWTPTQFIRLVQDYGLEAEVAQHLSRSYGTKAPQVARLAKLTGRRWPVVGQRLVDEFPYIEAEIYYGIREYACTAVDMMARRLRVAFLNCQAAEESLPRIIEIMGNNLGWDNNRRQKELEEALWFLDEMGYKNRMEVRNVPVNFTQEEVKKYTTIFRRFDINRTGHVTAPELRKILTNLGETDVSDEQLQELIAEVDLNMNNTIELDEFLQLMSALKTGAISNNRLGSLVERYYHHLLEPISTERSGGGV